MAEQAGAFIVPTMEMTREDKALLQAGKLPEQAVWKFRRDVDAIEAAQRRIAGSAAKVAYGTDCGMFPFSRGILEFQAMVAAGLTATVRSRRRRPSPPSSCNVTIWEPHRESRRTSSPCETIRCPTLQRQRRWTS